MSNDLYRDRAARFDTVVGDDAAYWSMLSRIMLDHDASWNFQDWCEQYHGFRLIYDEDGGITGRPEIVDPQKYTLCLLKYGG